MHSSARGARSTVPAAITHRASLAMAEMAASFTFSRPGRQQPNQPR